MSPTTYHPNLDGLPHHPHHYYHHVAPSEKTTTMISGPNDAIHVFWALGEFFFFFYSLFSLILIKLFLGFRMYPVVWAPVSSLHHYTTTPLHHYTTTRPRHHTKLPPPSSSRGWGLETGVSRALRGMFFFSSFFDHTNLFTFTVITYNYGTSTRTSTRTRTSTSTSTSTGTGTNSLREKAQTMRDASFGP